MVKWKKLNKKVAGVLLGVMVLFSASTTAFAYVDPSAETANTEAAQTETVQNEETEKPADEGVLPENNTTEKKEDAFTEPGNGEVQDDIQNGSSKEFLTITTKNNNTFYLVIDRSSTSQKLREWEQKILFLIAVHTVEAMEEDHVFMETEVEVRCQDEIFKAKGKVIKQIGWKLYEECFKNDDGLAIENPADAGKDHIPKVEVDHKFYNVSAAKTEHFTAPPKPYSEDTLLAAMETAGNKEFDEDTEKKGLGTPATRAGIIEKLIASQYAVRKGKQILPTEDGIILIDILPDFLKSATMTAEWENQLLEMEQGKMAPGQFMTGIEKLISMMLNHCDSIPEEETRRFQKKESLGTCPVCGGLVYEGIILPISIRNNSNST